MAESRTRLAEHLVAKSEILSRQRQSFFVLTENDAVEFWQSSAIYIKVFLLASKFLIFSVNWDNQQACVPSWHAGF